MTGSQKLYVFTGVFLGGLGLALPFRQLSPRDVPVTEKEAKRSDNPQSRRVSLAIEAGNEEELPSPRGSSPYFGLDPEGSEPHRLRETPVLQQSPAFHEPRPVDPLPRIGSEYEPLLQRRPFRETEENRLEQSLQHHEDVADARNSRGEDRSTSARPPTRWPSEQNPTALLPDERDWQRELPRQDASESSTGVDSSRSSRPEEHHDLALPRRDASNGADGHDASRTSESMGIANSSAGPPAHDPIDGTSGYDRQDSRADVSGPDRTWETSPRLRGWRETQIARAGDDTRRGGEGRSRGGRSRGGRNAPYAKYQTYRLRDGDTLPGLAYRFLGAEDRYPLILEMNRDIIRDPQVLPLGVDIRIPAQSSPNE